MDGARENSDQETVRGLEDVLELLDKTEAHYQVIVENESVIRECDERIRILTEKRRADKN